MIRLGSCSCRVGCPASIRFGETTADIENSYAGVCGTLAIGGKIEAMALIFIPPSTFAFHLRNFIMRNMPRAWLGHYFTNSIKSEIELVKAGVDG